MPTSRDVKKGGYYYHEETFLRRGLLDGGFIDDAARMFCGKLPPKLLGKIEKMVTLTRLPGVCRHGLPSCSHGR